MGKEEIGGFIVVNDSKGTPDGRFLCGVEPVVYEDYWAAVDERNRLREEHDNPCINVYPVLASAVEE